MEDLILKLQELLAVYGLKVVAALAIFILGGWAAKLISGALRKVLARKKVDEMLASFSCRFVYVLVMLFVVIAAISRLGVQTTSMVALLGATGLAIGLALQGSLANFAAGILMIIFRPFRVGDMIQGAGVEGIVEEIDIFTTKLRTMQNNTIVIPNARLTTENIVNYSAREYRRVDFVVGVSYDTDLDQAKAAIREALDTDERILKTPEPIIAVIELADSSVNVAVRPWVKPSDYWGVYYDTLETIKKKLDSAGITIPFPQRDVHMYPQQSGTA